MKIQVKIDKLWFAKKILLLVILGIFWLIYHYTNLFWALMFMFYIVLNNQLNIMEEVIDIKDETGEMSEIWRSISTIRKHI
jgi:hypothetical protein